MHYALLISGAALLVAGFALVVYYYQKVVKIKTIEKKNIKLANEVKKRQLALEEKTRNLEEARRKLETLSKVGQEITASLDFEAIFRQIYGHVNALMDATSFSVDIYHPESGQIEYKFSIEKGERLDSVFVKADSETSMSAWCIRNQKEIFIHDLEKEYEQYVSGIDILIGDLPNSLIYLPLMIEDKVIGAISAQSFEKNAYTEEHLSILKTLGSYSAIALSNASSYQQLTEAFVSIERQTKEIEHKNKALTDSLHYARRIQEAILPDMAEMRKYLPQCAVFYRPRDIVSGDFYWFSQRDHLSILAVVDCTGHGVPGAFMSVLGNSILNQLINEKNIYQADEILNELNDSVKSALHQMASGSETDDGMDLALVVYDRVAQKLQFAAANRYLFYVEGDEVVMLRGDRYPIGGRFTQEVYHKQEFDARPGFTFYLSTDGYADQFGGRKRRKLFNRRFLELLQRIHAEPMSEQERLLEEEFDAWKGENKQLDDILVIGVRL